MRFRTFILFVFWAALLGYLGYVGVSAGSHYFQMLSLVEASFTEVSKRQREPGPADAVRAEYSADLRAAILVAARKERLDMDPRSLLVSAEGDKVRVQFEWSYPVLVVGGQTAVSVPLWIDRAFDISRSIRR